MSVRTPAASPFASAADATALSRSAAGGQDCATVRTRAAHAVMSAPGSAVAPRSAAARPTSTSEPAPAAVTTTVSGPTAPCATPAWCRWCRVWPVSLTSNAALAGSVAVPAAMSSATVGLAGASVISHVRPPWSSRSAIRSTPGSLSRRTAVTAATARSRAPSVASSAGSMSRAPRRRPSPVVAEYHRPHAPVLGAPSSRSPPPADSLMDTPNRTSGLGRSAQPAVW